MWHAVRWAGPRMSSEQKKRQRIYTNLKLIYSCHKKTLEKWGKETMRFPGVCNKQLQISYKYKRHNSTAILWRKMMCLAVKEWATGKCSMTIVIMRIKSTNDKTLIPILAFMKINCSFHCSIPILD